MAVMTATGQIVYAITPKEIGAAMGRHGYTTADDLPVGVVLCEVWRGLPPYNFAKATSTDGRTALRARNGVHMYVWVPPDAAEALAAEPDCILFALGYPRRHGRVDFFWIQAVPNKPLADAIAEARRFNVEAVDKAMRRH